ncbi:MAG: DUF1636 domain-containing protein [Neomegalonema sp.]|nr:DUF1636 domain-containing protein [Neomegalonema sp.]
MTDKSTLIICETCAWPDGEKLKDGQSGGAAFADLVAAAAAAAAEQGASSILVRRHACLMNCSQSCSAALSAPDKITYVFGRFEPSQSAAEALIEYAEGHAASDTGAVPFRQWPQGVKGKFIARVPPQRLLENDDADEK